MQVGYLHVVDRNHPATIRARVEIHLLPAASHPASNKTQRLSAPVMLRARAPQQMSQIGEVDYPEFRSLSAVSAMLRTTE
jgi:hypothetical protein